MVRGDEARRFRAEYRYEWFYVIYEERSWNRCNGI